MFSTFLRPDRVHTSYVAGIVSMDQRLMRFQLHPGAEDPGPGNWKSAANDPAAIPSTGCWRHSTAASRSPQRAAASTSMALPRERCSVAPRHWSTFGTGESPIGVWGRDVRMTKDVEGSAAEPAPDRGPRKGSCFGEQQCPEQLGRHARRRVLRLALGTRDHGRPGGSFTSMARRLNVHDARRPAPAGRRGRGHAARHQPGMDVLHVLQVARHPSDPTPVQPAA